MSVIDSFSNMDINELRKEAEERLQWCYAHGHISIDSLESKLDEIHKTEDKKEILALVADLPAPESTTQGDAERDDSRYHGGTGKTKEDYFSLLGSNSRKGNWDVPEKLDVSAILGSQVLDFRNARFPRTTVKIQAFSFMGSIDMKFPRGVEVVTKGIPVLGSIENRVESEGPGPRVEVEGFALLGSITAKTAKSK